MPSSSAKRVVLIAIIANVAIAIAKYVAAGFTGSSAMLAEAFHSTADTGNELLLILGIKRSRRPPDRLHPFGHGKVLYFYSLLVAIYIFAFGAALAFYRGITRMRAPIMPSYPGWNYAVLALAALFELYSWRVSYRVLLAQKDPDESTWDEIIGSKDPTIFTIFLEDSAGLAGTLIAFLGIFLSRTLHNPYFDPLASILIGVLLTVVSFFLGRESGALLVGERTNRRRIRRIRKILEGDSSVQKVGDVLTMQLGPDEVLVTVDIRFQPGLDVRELEHIIARLEGSIKKAEPMVQRIFLEPGALKNISQKAA